MSSEVAEKIFAIVKDSAVLVGGQSLAFWVARYEIPTDSSLGAISKDADYLGDASVVTRIGRGFSHATVTFPPPFQITAIVGNVHIIPDDESYMNVDVIHKIVGIRSEAVKARAVPVSLPMDVDTYIQVMHPLHILRSRLHNFYYLRDKRTPNGVMQRRLAVQVAGRYVQDVARQLEGGQRIARKMIEEIVTLAKCTPGRVAKLHGIDFREAIPFAAIESQLFQERRVPRLLKELSDAQPPKNWTPIDGPIGPVSSARPRGPTMG
jgi:hypothetical protein